MTPLRQRLIHDLQLRNYAPRTISVYVAAVARFAAHFGRSPDQLDADHVRQYQLHLLAQKVSWCRFNQTVCALRFFYSVTLQQPDVVAMLPYGKKPKTLPAVLSAEEVVRLFAALSNPRDLMILQTAYAAGSRVSEVVRLQVSDIDSQRMTLHIRCAKGRKDRFVPLSAVLLARLRDYWRGYRPKLWRGYRPKPQVGVSLGEIGFELDGVAVSLLRLLGPVLAVQGKPQITVGLGGIGLELDGVAVGLLRLLVPALAAQDIPQVVVGQRKIGLELDGVAVGLLRFLYPSTAFFSSLSTPRPSAYSSPSSFIA